MKRLLVVMLAAGSVVGCRQREPKTPQIAELPAQTQPAQPTQQAPTAVAPATQQAAIPTPPPPAPVQPPVVVPPTPTKSPAIATADGVEIPRDRVVDLVMESHGLNMLLRVVQVELAKSLAQKEGLNVTTADFAREREDTLYKMSKEANQDLLDKIAAAKKKEDSALANKLQDQFKSESEAMLQQALAKENMTPGEFDLLMQTNAWLRKLVEKQLTGKITEENVKEAFLNIYGENVRVRHIQLANVGEVSEAQAKLKAGVPFEQVAREMSRNAATRSLGGELLPFSRDTQGLPDSFKQVAFSLKTPGEVSEPVEANGTYHLIQLIESIPPKAIKFEDVKESVREQLYDRWVTERMKVLRETLARQAMDSLKIQDPVLAAQFRDRVNKRENELKEREQIARELAREREAQAKELMNAATRPANATQVTQPATRPASTTRSSTGILRPPATTSGSDTPDLPKTTSPAK